MFITIEESRYEQSMQEWSIKIILKTTLGPVGVAGIMGVDGLISALSYLGYPPSSEVVQNFVIFCSVLIVITLLAWLWCIVRWSLNCWKNAGSKARTGMLYIFFGGIGTVVCMGIMLYGAREYGKTLPLENVETQNKELDAAGELTALQKRHWTKNDKNRISDGFYELEEIFKEAKKLDTKAQNALHALSAQSDRAANNTPFEFDTIIERMKEVKRDCNKIHILLHGGENTEGLLNTYSSYKEVWNQILETSIPSPLSTLQLASQRLLENLKAAKDTQEHSDSADLLRNLSTLLRDSKDVFRQRDGEFNGWLVQASKRKERLKQEILTDR